MARFLFFNLTFLFLGSKKVNLRLLAGLVTFETDGRQRLGRQRPA
jgi:hypothetical protein